MGIGFIPKIAILGQLRLSDVDRKSAAAPRMDIRLMEGGSRENSISRCGEPENGPA